MSKPLKPVDRALADVRRQMETVERELRVMGHAPSARGTVPRETARGFLRKMLTPPSQRPVPRPRRDLFDVPVNPLQELDDRPEALPSTQPELFPATGTKLAQYLAAASVQSPKPQLKHVQRENRHRFYVWLGLSFVAVWLIYAVVR